MSTVALEKTFKEFGWLIQPDDYAREVADARVTLADAGVHPIHLDIARKIVAAADKGEGAAERAAGSPEQLREAKREREAERETEKLERQRSGKASAGEAEEEVILGILGSGTEMTLAGCRASGMYPVDYLQTPGASLTKIGRRLREGLLAIAASDPSHRARALGIPLEAVTAAAQREGWDPTATLQGELSFQDLVARDRQRSGLSPAQPRTFIPVPGTGVIGADGNPAKAEADLQALIKHEKAAAGCR